MATADAVRRRRALLIASGTYLDPGLARLRAPTADVRALAEVLGDDAIGGFDVRQAIDESTENVKREIEGFFVDSRLGDLLLLYFSGHGVLSQSRRFYFATATTELKWLGSTAVDDRFVNEMMEHSRARTIVLILDCCHSGAFGRGLAPKSALTVDVEHRFDGQGRVTLSASTELEYAFEETDPATAISELEPAAPGSLFTSCLVEGLTTGEADIDEDGEVTLDELYEYLYRRVRERSPHQTPGRAGSVRGGIVIARTRRRPALAGELLAASRSSLPAVRLGAAGELAKLLPSPQADLAAAAFRELERLERDDDHGVAVAAAAALGRPPPPPPAPSRRGRVRSAVALTGVAAIAVAATFVATLGGPTSAAGPVPYDFDGDGAQEIAIAPVQAGTATVLIHSGPDAEAPIPVSAAAAGLPRRKRGHAGRGRHRERRLQRRRSRRPRARHAGARGGRRALRHGRGGQRRPRQAHRPRCRRGALPPLWLHPAGGRLQQRRIRRPRGRRARAPVRTRARSRSCSAVTQV